MNSPDSTTISVEDLHTVGPASDPSPNRSPLNGQRQTSAADNNIISFRESAANSTSEDTPIGGEGEPPINAGSAEVGTLSVSIAGRDPAVNPVNDGETINSPVTVAVRDTHLSNEVNDGESNSPVTVAVRDTHLSSEVNDGETKLSCHCCSKGYSSQQRSQRW